eukprot:3667811-Prymnesium_polylepis.1
MPQAASPSPPPAKAKLVPPLVIPQFGKATTAAVTAANAPAEEGAVPQSPVWRMASELVASRKQRIMMAWADTASAATLLPDEREMSAAQLKQRRAIEKKEQSLANAIKSQASRPPGLPDCLIA